MGTERSVILGDDGELTTEAIAEIEKASLERGLSRREIEKRIKEREKLMLRLMKKLEREGRGNESLYRTIGRGKDRLVLLAVPNICTDEYRHKWPEYLCFHRTGFFRFAIGEGKYILDGDGSELQNPFSLREDRYFSVYQLAAFYKAVIVGDKKYGERRLGTNVYFSNVNGYKIPSELKVSATSSWDKEVLDFKIYSLDQDEFNQRFLAINETINNFYEEVAQRTDRDITSASTIIGQNFKRKNE